MAVLKCKMCGGDLEVQEGASVCECTYCGTKQTLPRMDNEKKMNLYDRANHFRRNSEYDKATAIYEQILEEDKEDAESYWSLVLCTYGIDYVEDPTTHKRMPTVNRAQYTSIFADENYKSAIQYADGYQKQIYEEEAKQIDEIQKGILSISSREEPFDVFICYKETDAAGNRTPDSVLANDLYHQLTQEGFKVFFARITLEDKLGSAYEPYIFAALNSAKVMVVLGTKPEYFQAVWVKNEWSRYLSLIKNGAKKVLIPAYKDMDPYDLPQEFSHLQSQDMGKLGFMQDLIRGIRKLTGTDTQPQAVGGGAAAQSSTEADKREALLKRMYLFLEDGDFAQAENYAERVLDQDSENGEAYLGKLMAALKVRKREELAQCLQPFDGLGDYQKILRFGSEPLKAEVTGYNQAIEDRKRQEEANDLENRYQSAVRAIREAKDISTIRSALEFLGKNKNYQEAATYLQTGEEIKRNLEKLAKSRRRKRRNGIIAGMAGIFITVLIVFGAKTILEKRALEAEAREEALRVAQEVAQAALEREDYDEAYNALEQVMGSKKACEEMLAVAENHEEKKEYEKALIILNILMDTGDSSLADRKKTLYRTMSDDHLENGRCMEAVMTLLEGEQDTGAAELKERAIDILEKAALDAVDAGKLDEAVLSKMAELNLKEEMLKVAEGYEEKKEYEKALIVLNELTDTGDSSLTDRKTALYRAMSDDLLENGRCMEAVQTLLEGKQDTGVAELKERADYILENLVIVEYMEHRDGYLIVDRYDVAGKLIEHFRYEGGVKEDWYEYEYDATGNLTKKICYDDDGSIYLWYGYEYDAAGNQTKQICYHDDGSIYYWDEYEYDATGNMTKEIRYYTDGSIPSNWYEYEYDTTGNLTKKIEHDYWDGSIESWDEYEYDATGNMTKEIEYVNDYYGTSLWCWYEYEYDTAGNQTKTIRYRGDDGSIGYWREYEYDAAGNMTKETKYHGDGSIEDWYKYEYNAAGNKTKWTRYYADGSIAFRREYEYDAAGNMTKETEYLADGSIEFSYDFVNKYQYIGE